MADEKSESKKPSADKAAAAPSDKGKKKRKLKPLIFIGGLMSIEAVGILVGVKMFGGAPAASHAEVVADEHAAVAQEADSGKSVELVVTELDAYNTVTGRATVYHIQVCVVAKVDQEQKLRELIESRQNTLQDRIQTILRSATPQQITEPGLETLKQQFRKEIETVLGVESGIEEVLIPKLLQMRA